MGYPKKTKGYYFYDQTKSKVFGVRNGVLLEKEFLSERGNGNDVQLSKVQDLQAPVAAKVEDDSETIQPTQNIKEVELVTQEPRFGRETPSTGEIWSSSD